VALQSKVKLRAWYLNIHRFQASADKNGQIKGEQKGIHVNFQPQISILFQSYPGGAMSVSVHYYAKLKVASGIAMGILTGGLSTLVGVGTFASHAVDAEKFIHAMWIMMDNMAKSPSQTIKEGTSVQQYLIQTPVVQQPIVQQPIVQSPIIQQQYFQPQPVVQQPIVQQPIVQQPIIQHTTSYSEQQYVQTQPTIQTPVVQQPITSPSIPSLDFKGYTGALGHISTSELNETMMKAKDLCWAIERELGMRRMNGQ
jgi:hypothetical protein